MKKEQAIEAFASGTCVWFNDRSMSFACKKIVGIDDTGCFMYDYSGNNKIHVKFSEIGLSEIEAMEGHYKHRIVIDSSDVIRHAEKFGMSVAGSDGHHSIDDDQYDMVVEICSNILDQFDVDESLDNLPVALSAIVSARTFMSKMCKSLDIDIDIGDSIFDNLVKVNQKVIAKNVKVGQRWLVFNDNCVIVDINGLKAVNVDNGEYFDCNSETFLEHGMLM